MFYHFLACSMILFSTFFLSNIINQKIRDKYVPIVFALMIFSTAVRISMHNWLFTYWLLFINMVGTGFILNGFRGHGLSRNSTAVLFLLFWIYMLISMLFGEIKGVGVLTLIHTLIGPIATGFFAGVWARKDERNWQRLLLYVLLAIVGICIVYVGKGSLANMAEAEHQGRGGFSGDLEMGQEGGTNVNAIALMVAGLLSFPFISLFENFSAIRFWRNKVFLIRGVSAVCFLSLVIMLVRTGARNGALAILPIVWYGLFAHTRVKLYKRLILFGIVCALAVFWVGRHMGKDTELRIFKYVSDQTTYTDDKFGGSRLGYFRDWTSVMTMKERIFGSGVHVGYVPGMGLVMANAHSMYMQVFLQSGYIGLFLMLVFYLRMSVNAFRFDDKRAIAVLMFGVWAMTGVGESQNIMLGGVSKHFLGIALAFCSVPRKLYFVNPNWR